MDVTVFADFTYDNEDAWNDFVLANGFQHMLYNSMLQQYQVVVTGNDLFDIEDTKDSRADWLLSHYKAHLQLAGILNMGGISDLSDVELNDNDQFSNWLQLHYLIHQQLDQIFGV